MFAFYLFRIIDLTLSTLIIFCFNIKCCRRLFV